MNKRGKGSLIILSGPSGAGKSTVISQVLARRPDIYFSVSYTTRKPRPGEVDGVNYHYVDNAQFERMISEDALLEYAGYVDHYYGTSRKLVEDNLNAGRDVLLDIEVQGASIIRSKRPDAVSIFLMPPSFGELSNRLHGRHTDSEEVIQSRLTRAREEFQSIGQYNYLVINDDVSDAVEQVCAILDAADCRVENRLNIFEGV